MAIAIRNGDVPLPVNGVYVCARARASLLAHRVRPRLAPISTRLGLRLRLRLRLGPGYVCDLRPVRSPHRHVPNNTSSRLRK